MAKNPGQNNNQEEGPPDLDELLNDLGKKLAESLEKKKLHKRDLNPTQGMQALSQAMIIFRFHLSFLLLF